MDASIWVLLFTLIIAFGSTLSQDSGTPVNCTRVYRNVQRHGTYILGQLTIPMSDLGREDNVEQGFRVQLSLNKAVRSVHVRQAKAREMGTSHMNFMIDTTPKDGAMKLDTAIRLRSGFRQHAPRVVRVIYNGKALCGPSLTPSEEDESVTVNAIRIRSSSTTTRTTTRRDFNELDDDYYY